MPLVADDHVIRHPNAEDFAPSHQPPGDRAVRLRRLRLSRRMVVEEHYAVGCADDRHPEHVARVHGAFVEGPGGEEVMSADAELRVEDDHHEAFPLGIEQRILLHMEAPVVGRLLGCVTVLHLLGSRAFPQGCHLPLLRLSLPPLGMRNFPPE